MNIYNIINKLLRVRGNISKIRFSVGSRLYEAYVPDDEYWGAIDVGAHVGLYSLVASSYAKKIIAVEPHPVNYRLLEINKMINNAETIETLNAAVVGQADQHSVKLCEGNHSGSSSIMETSPRCYQAPAIKLSDIIENYTSNKILVKMDIEGAEFEVLKSMNREALKHIERIVMEVHLRYGPIDAIVDKLRQAGFTVKYLHPPLVTKDAKPPIRVQDMAQLKILRSTVYSIAKLGRLKVRDLAILFAYKHE